MLIFSEKILKVRRFFKKVGVKRKKTRILFPKNSISKKVVFPLICQKRPFFGENHPLIRLFCLIAKRLLFLFTFTTEIFIK